MICTSQGTYPAGHSFNTTVYDRFNPLTRMNTDDFQVQAPESMSDDERRAYLRGLRDMAEYMQHVGFKAQQFYEAEMSMTEQKDNPCPNCGEEMIYDGTSGLQCMECNT